MHPVLLGAEQVKQALASLSLRQLERLAEVSGVPVATIYKIKRGETSNPGIETVRKFMPHVDGLREAA